MVGYKSLSPLCQPAFLEGCSWSAFHFFLVFCFFIGFWLWCTNEFLPRRSDRLVLVVRRGLRSPLQLYALQLSFIASAALRNRM
jgi:hypothetical protein